MLKKQAAKTLCILGLVSLAAIALSGCGNGCESIPNAPIWQKVYANQYGTVIEESLDGGFLIAGSRVTEDDYLGMPYVMKTNATGQSVWNVDLADDGLTYAYEIAELDDGSVLLTAGSDYTIQLIRLSSDGATLWSRTLYDEEEGYYPYTTLCRTSDGNAVIVYAEGSPLNVAGDYHVEKINPAGDILWSYTLDSTNVSYIGPITASDDGGAYLLTATYDDDPYFDDYKLTPVPAVESQLVRLSSDGVERWTIDLPADLDSSGDMAESDDGGVVLMAYDRVARFDNNGGMVWNKSFQPSHTYADSIHATPDGGFILGTSAYQLFIFPPIAQQTCGNSVLIKMNGNGDVLWEREYGTAEVEALSDVAPTSDGGYVLLGDTNIHPTGYSSDMFLMKVDGE